MLLRIGWRSWFCRWSCSGNLAVNVDRKARFARSVSFLHSAGSEAAAAAFAVPTPRGPARAWLSPHRGAGVGAVAFSSTSVRLRKRKGGKAAGDSSEEEEEDLDVDDEVDLGDQEVEELFEQRSPGVPEGGQRVFIVHPDVKWGAQKQHLTTGDLQMAEAVALVNTLPNWRVVDKIILSTKTPDKRRIFGKGNFQTLTEKIRGLPQITAVFMNVERLSALTQKELQESWGVKVFDRYTVVLHIFRCNARTKEAKLQIALAEIPLLKSHLKSESSHLDQQGGGSRYIMGSGETFMEVQQRLLKERELKIKNALVKLRKKRHLLRSQRKQREFPIISVMGYTNCGKTTLIKALTGDVGLQPRDQLFATLDITAHAGFLPSHMTILYVDTIGFLSQLPHNLIESFSATLEDVAHSDLIVHVRDISHPETINQKLNVLTVLKNLHLPSHLLDSIIEVHNKIDLLNGYQPTEPSVVPVSALHGSGLEELKNRIEEAVLKATGKLTLTIKIDLSGQQLSWLYKEATVQEVDVLPDDGAANVKVIISKSAHGRYKKLFQQ
ncbi:putative GTP-binding protein 6 [Latimeria chalumnae]|uniref:Putative GTP-binding protein 6 n=1 Tax=Latimeria chalumnae TaxID=7897 RepID=H3AXX3_LATCH|nr:PREDICTED: putative GTP-binding protein 6 isoform X2 [Latimeria chalumnae]|eukprot:XP_005999040.1 PREDICTED: putative GTP-binding protein 6 isoform X2 [Latimeria chalumnae]